MASDPAACFLWRKMLERQRRWFEHGADGQPLRDEHARFLPSAANPLPQLNPFDKLLEREYCEAMGVPQPKLVAVIRTPNELLSLELPPSWVLKPARSARSSKIGSATGRPSIWAR